MSKMNDAQIKAYAEKGMIIDFIPERVDFVPDVRDSKNKIKAASYGLDYHGYVVRVGRDARLMPRTDVDPLNIDDYEKQLIPVQTHFDEYGREYFILRSQRSYLIPTIESFNMPENVIGLPGGKSTYSRACVIFAASKLEAGWKPKSEGEPNHYNVLAFASGGNVRMYVNQGLIAINFEEVEPAEMGAYNGNYNGQKGVVAGMKKKK